MFLRWKLVIHGGVDGKSRMNVFLKCSDNNKASTVYYLFTGAVRDFGLPSRLRTDRGGENELIKSLMNSKRGLNRGSCIQGKSVHNQ